MSAGLQDAFLAECKRQGVNVTFSMTGGMQMQGRVKGFDAFTVLVEFDNKTQLIYKHAIATISPDREVDVSDAATRKAAAAP